MDAFEYLSVLLSIVLGLGITQLLSGFGRWLEHRGTLRPYGPAIAWAALLLLVHVQTWWSMFGLRSFGTWNFLQFSMVLLQPILLFLLAVLVFPGPAATELDLRTNFFKQRPWFFGLLALLVAVSVLKDVVRAGSLPEPLNLAFHVAFFILAASALATTAETWHRIIAYTGLLFMTLYIALLYAQLV